MDSAKIESGVQLFSRLHQRPNVENLYPAVFSRGPFPNETIEITGMPITGKTLLITDLLARCILPSCHQGRNCGAILINTDHQFDILKLINIMEIIIKDSNGDMLERNLENAIRSGLNNLIILNCYDSLQLQITFLNLEKILLENLNIGLVVLDSLSTFYWEYRISKGIISFQNYHCKMLDCLKNSVQNSCVVTMFTRSEFEQMAEKDHYSSNETYAITLKQSGENFIAFITNNVCNTSKRILYNINGNIQFLA